MSSKVISKSTVFETKGTSVSQCDRSEKFFLHFLAQPIELKLCELIGLRRKIEKIDLTALVSSQGPDIEVLYLSHQHPILLLSIYEILELREVLTGTFTMLELNSLIHKTIHRKFS
tara:strand:+ start:337 stop:684 length:348 start_codon:yes stop_codon:yes gene_type:complete